MMETDGTIRTSNDAWGRLVGADTASLAGTSVLDAAASAFRGTLADALAEVAAGTDSVRMDIQLRRATGERVWVDAALAPIREGDARVEAVIVQATDLTDRKHLERVLADQASRDPLTGLLNREGLSRELAHRGQHEPREGNVNVVVYADVDHLKEVNDTIGHSAGDDLLREVAGRLTAALREDDIIARVGGDEFVVVTATRAIGPDPTAVIVSRLRDELAGPVAVGREIVTMSVSLGAAVVTGDVATAIASADRAMYSERRRRRQSERG
jgi:diguanylate cyclase (GGDEF)-like protein/PAS domain S-box-containing protein